MIMKKRVLMVIALLAISFNIQAKEFYEDLSAKQRQELAESYRKTGERFLELGQKARGKYYLDLADKIAAVPLAPSLPEQEKVPSSPDTNTPEEQPNIQQPSKPADALMPPAEKEKEPKDEPPTHSFLYEEPLPALPLPESNKKHNFPADPKDWPAVGDDPAEASKALMDRYLSGLISENTPLVLSAFAPSVALPGYEEGLNRDEQTTFYNELFTAFQFDSLDLSDIYDMNSMEVKVLDDFRTMITIKSVPKPPTILADWRYWDGFWGKTHHYFFEKIDGKWGLIAFDIAYED